MPNNILIKLALAFFLLCSVSAFAGSYEDLLAAVKGNDGSAVDALIARGMDVNTTDPNGNTLLMIAIHEDHLEMAGTLLQRKPALDLRNQYGETALMLAAAGGNLNLVKQLVEHGATINLSGWNPLIYAAWRGHAGVVKYLLEKGANIDAVGPSGVSALMMATREGQYDTVKLLLWEVADPNLRSDSGATALQWALKAGNTDIAALLRLAGAKE